MTWECIVGGLVGWLLGELVGQLLFGLPARRQRKALEWYADIGNYNRLKPVGGVWCAALLDMGKRARVALGREEAV